MELALQSALPSIPERLRMKPLLHSILAIPFLLALAQSAAAATWFPIESRGAMIEYVTLDMRRDVVQTESPNSADCRIQVALKGDTAQYVLYFGSVEQKGYAIYESLVQARTSETPVLLWADEDTREFSMFRIGSTERPLAIDPKRAATNGAIIRIDAQGPNRFDAMGRLRAGDARNPSLGWAAVFR
jgi:hypothetical protein